MIDDEKMTPPTHLGPLRRAAGNIIAAIQEIDHEIASIEGNLKEAKACRSELVSALSALVRTLPEDERKRFAMARDDSRAAGGEIDLLPDSPMQAIMNMMIAREKDTVKVEEVQNFLDEKGFGVSSRYASNTLRKLAEQGHLVRIGRGRYRLNDMNLHMMGLTQEDYQED